MYGKDSESLKSYKTILSPIMGLNQKVKKQITKEVIMLFVFFLLFVSAWGTIVMGKFYSLHSYVFDLGFVMQRLWQPYHVLSFGFFSFVLFSSGFQLVLSPLYLLNSLQAILIVQLLAIGSTCFPLYGIAKMKLGSNALALLLSVAYLFYFPSSGILWFDVHIQAFFIPLFVFGYYFQLKEKYTISTILFVLSGTVKFPYSLFPIVFSLIDILEQKIKMRSYLMNKYRIRSDLAIFFFSSIFFFGGYLFVILNNNSTGISFVSTTFPDRVFSLCLTIIAIAGPFFFLPLTKLKWLLLILPFFLLGFYTGSANYVFPAVFRLQYTSMVVPFVFIGTIEALAPTSGFSITSGKPKKPSSLARLLRVYSTLRTKLVKRRRNILVAILCLIFVGSVFYQPYSPLNSISNVDFNFSQKIGFNSSDYNTLMSLVHMIPSNDPYVLFQNDMPELLPRPSVDNLPFLFTTYLSSNVTLGEVANNTFPILASNGHTRYTNVDYLIAYTQSAQYYLQFGSGESTLPQILSLMLDSGKYGILGEAKGFILVERDYSGIPRLYEPLILNKPFNATNVSGGATFHDLSSPKGSSTIVTLVPGTYTVKFYISVSNNSALARVCGGLGYSLGKSLSQTFCVPGSYFKTVNSQIAVTFNISVPNQESNTVFLISAFNFVGNITIYDVSLIQTSY